MVNKGAQAGIYTLMYTQQWRLTSTKFGHTNKSQDMEQEPFLQMGPDLMFPREELPKPFMVKCPYK